MLNFAKVAASSDGSKIIKRPSLKTYLVNSAAIAIMSVSALSAGSESSQSILTWFTPYVDVKDTHDLDKVPAGYWSKLVSVLGKAPLLPEDDYSIDPDPIV